MGRLVKNIFAFATLFFCCDFSSTRVGLCMEEGGEGYSAGSREGSGRRRVCNSIGRKTEKIANDFRGE